jgi:hypothetical protein
MRSPATKGKLMPPVEHSSVAADTVEHEATGCGTPFFLSVYLSDVPAALDVESAIEKLVTFPATGIGICVRV